MKKKGKLLLSIMLIAAMVFALAGCGGGGEDSSSSESDKTYKVGILQLLEHPALDEATKGFKQAMIDELGEDGVEFDEENAQNEVANCSTIAGGFVTDKVDLILANATPALQACAAATDKIPIVGTSITDYATALDVSDWTGKTGNNITGTSDLAPLDEQAAMIKEIVPDAKKVGILYCSAEANSIYQAKQIEKSLDGLGLEYAEYTAADSNEIQSVTTKAASECDVLYVPTDNTMAGSTETIKNVVVEKKIPLIAGEQGICQVCGVATLSISYYDIGYEAGKMAVRILKDGENPGDIEIATAPKVTKLYNEELCKQLGVTIPDGYEAIEVEEDSED